MSVTPYELHSILKVAFEHRDPIMVTGASGIGKSEIVEKAANDVGYDLLISHPSIEDPTDTKGFGFPNAKRTAAEFLPFGDMEIMINAKEPLIVFFDDFGQATPAVQAAKMQLLLKRQVGCHKISDHVRFVAATNRRVDRANVSGILGPVKRRFCSILELSCDAAQWTNWAIDKGFPSELVAFIHFRPELLLQSEIQEIENSPSPRGWKFVKDGMTNYPRSVQDSVICGAVGSAAGTEFNRFRQIADRMPDPRDVFRDPDTAAIPDEQSVRYAVVTAVAAMCDSTNFDKVVRYALRYIKAGLNEWAVVLFLNTVRRKPELEEHPAYVVGLAGGFSEILTGID